MQEAIAITSRGIGAVPARQVEIPHTDPSHYITGVYALNVPSPEGTTGDWHDVFHWRGGLDRPAKLQLGGSDWVDTGRIYGDLGIYDGHESLVCIGIEVPDDGEPVFVANHFRAILDLLHHSLSTHEAVYNLAGATDDWLDTDEQKTLVLDRAGLLRQHVSPKAQVALADWIASEQKGRLS